MAGQGLDAKISTYISNLGIQAPGSILHPSVRIKQSAENLRDVMAGQGYNIVFSGFEGPVYTANAGLNMKLCVTAECPFPPGVGGPHAKRLAFQLARRCVIPVLVREANDYLSQGTVIQVAQRCANCPYSLEPVSAAVEDLRQSDIIVGQED